MSSEATLIEELLHNAAASGNRLLERRMADLAVWFYQNRKRISPENVMGKQAFTEKAIWTLVELCALQAERIHELEARGSGKALWVPQGLAVNGDMRRFG